MGRTLPRSIEFPCPKIWRGRQALHTLQHTGSLISYGMTETGADNGNGRRCKQ